MSELEITVAQPHERTALENLMQLYVHDFSEQWADQARGEVGPDGRFEAYPLDGYWAEPERVPLLIRRGGHLAGFALLNTHSHSGRAIDRSVAEFFILRKHRRGGIGLAAARTILARYPGVWEAAVARRNTGALPFWRKVAAAYGEVEEIDVVSDDWNGPVLRFRV